MLFLVLSLAVLVLETLESIQGDHLFKEAGSPEFGLYVNNIPIRPFEYEYRFTEYQYEYE
jgi:hypothetical protein